MILFGWGHVITKVFGPTFKRVCDHCHNEQYWVLSRITTWFTLFFIPVFPYEWKYFLACPICQYGVELNGEQIQKIRPLAEANQLLIDGNITQDEYHNRIALLSGEPAQEPVPAEVVEVLPPPAAEDLKFCGDCGKEIVKEVKFCSQCGAQQTANV